MEPNSKSQLGLRAAQGLQAPTCISTSVARKVKISWSSRILRSSCWISLCRAEISFRACRVTCVSFSIWGADRNWRRCHRGTSSQSKVSAELLKQPSKCEPSIF